MFRETRKKKRFSVPKKISRGQEGGEKWVGSQFEIDPTNPTAREEMAELNR